MDPVPGSSKLYGYGSCFNLFYFIKLIMLTCIPVNIPKPLQIITSGQKKKIKSSLVCKIYLCQGLQRLQGLNLAGLGCANLQTQGKRDNFREYK